jgi:RNA-dependent RNA polymerase
MTFVSSSGAPFPVHFLKTLTTDAEGCEGVSKPSSEQTMTDGCGWINRSALRMISDILGTETCPTAVQGRVKGGKGLWILHHSNDDPEPQIWIRSSQKKIEYGYPLDRSHRILDLLTISDSSSPSGLTKQSIMNVWFNGVPEQTLVDMMENSMREAVEPFLMWEGLYAMPALYKAIDNAGNVSKGRKMRKMAELSRALGFQKRDWGHEDIGMGEPGSSQGSEGSSVDDFSQATYTGRNEISGGTLYCVFSLLHCQSLRVSLYQHRYQFMKMRWSWCNLDSSPMNCHSYGTRSRVS